MRGLAIILTPFVWHWPSVDRSLEVDPVLRIGPLSISGLPFAWVDPPEPPERIRARRPDVGPYRAERRVGRGPFARWRPVEGAFWRYTPGAAEGDLLRARDARIAALFRFQRPT